MDGSRMLQVCKRDGSVEAFDRHKLAGRMWAAMQQTAGTLYTISGRAVGSRGIAPAVGGVYIVRQTAAGVHWNTVESVLRSTMGGLFNVTL